MQNNRHRFCRTHQALGSVCAIIGCISPVLPGTKACGNPSHQAVEKVHRERGQSRFQLQDRLARARVTHPSDSFGDHGAVTNNSDLNADTLEDDDDEEEFTITENGTALPVDTQTQAASGLAKLKAQFGRKRTHNEQVIVAPCGMIIARETFYGAEAVSSVVVRLRVFLFDIFLTPKFNHSTRK